MMYDIDELYRSFCQRNPRRHTSSRAIRWFVTGLLSAFAFLSSSLNLEASAKPIVNMTADVGFAGYYGKNNWVPVYLTIQNTGSAANAVLAVDVNQPVGDGRVALGSLQWPIWLPAHGWTHKEVYVPGSLVDAPATVDCFVNGRTISTTFLSGNAVGNVALVAVLSSQAQNAQFLTGSTDGPTGNPVLPVSISPQVLPANANLLNGLTAICASPWSLSQLTDTQQVALLTWVKLGGLLLVTGTGGVTPLWQGNLPLLPGPFQTVAGGKLALYVGGSVTAPSQLFVAAGGVQARSTVWAGTNKQPLLAERDFGRGKIVQTAFSPTQPGLLGWSGNAALWTSILGQGDSSGQSALPALLDPAGVLSLTAASDALSPLRVPSLRFWLSLFILYTLLAGPLLFFILRRFKAEAWAWWTLPVLSIFTTLGIYGFGAAQRPTGILTENLGVLDLAGDGDAEVYGIRAFTSPSITSGNVTLPAGTLALPLAQPNIRQLGAATVTNKDDPTVAYSGIGRWGIRYLYMAGAATEQGQLTVRLWGTAFGGLFGTVRNNTVYSLHDVALFWNGQMYSLGDLDPGSVAGVGEQTLAQDATGNWLSVYGTYNHGLTRGFGRALGGFAAQNLSTANFSTEDAMLVATTDKETIGVPILNTAQRVASSQSIVLVRQFATVTTGLE